MLGKRFGKLTVVRKCGTDKRRNYYWECLCDCGNRVFPRSYSLKNGNTTTCGCSRRKKIGHHYPHNYDKLVLERIFKKVKIRNKCWIWTGCTKTVTKKDSSHPYGRTTYKGKPITVHRLMYQLKKGVIPENMCILHSCDNTLCVNPDHLSIGTQGDNIRDMHKKQRHPWSRVR